MTEFPITMHRFFLQSKIYKGIYAFNRKRSMLTFLGAFDDFLPALAGKEAREEFTSKDQDFSL